MKILLIALGLISTSAFADSPACSEDVIRQRSIVAVKDVMAMAEPDALITNILVAPRPTWENIKETVDIVVLFNIAKKNTIKTLPDYSEQLVAQLSFDPANCTVQLWSTRAAR